MRPRRFPPPWSAELQPNHYVVRDANKQQLAYVYYENEPGRRSAAKLLTKDEARRVPWVLTKEESMNDRTKADKAWEARQEAARYRIFNAATNAAEATDEADDEKYFAVLDQAGNAAEAAAAKITGYNSYADLLEALDTRHKQSQGDEYGERRLHR